MESGPEDREGRLQEPGEEWRFLTTYERFEQIVAVVLSGVIAVIVVVSLIQLIRTVASLLIRDGFNPLDHAVFQTVFGMIMTLLIALEFRHSIVRVALRRDSMVQVKTVLLIALIALSRKFVILDIEATGAGTIAALSGALLALGAVYGLMPVRDEPAGTVPGRVTRTRAPKRAP
jgi:uncharacterized membrane protein (DUF373 family)